MIIRILGEGQFDVPDPGLDELNALDEALISAIDLGDEDAFMLALEGLLDGVRRLGARLPDDYLGPSQFVLPAADSSLEEVRSLLGEEGLLPG